MSGKLSKLFNAQDMTVGSPVKGLIQFSVPLLIGNLAQQLYNTVDSIVVGTYVGDNALAAVGASGPVVNLLLVLFMGISTGATIMVSQYFGAREKDHLSHTAGTAITLSLLTSIFIMILGPLISRPMMSLLNTPPDIFEQSCTYLDIIFIGIIGMAYYNILSGMLRGLGDSVTPLLFLLIACGLNIVLDVWFVAGLGWGVAGVAIATAIAQLVSAVLCMVRLVLMRDIVTINFKMLKLKKVYVMQLVKLGLPAGLTQAIFSMAQIVVQSLTNSFGTAVIAANTAVMRVDGFAMMPNFTFGNAMTTYTGQNMGANRLDRVHEGTKDGMKIGLIFIAALVACILIFGEFLLRMFTSTPEVIDLGVSMLRVLALGYLAVAVTQILSGVMRGAGDTMTPMWISIITTVILRVPIAYGIAYLTRDRGFSGRFPVQLVCFPVNFLGNGSRIDCFLFKRGKWRSKGIVKPGEEAKTITIE